MSGPALGLSGAVLEGLGQDLRVPYATYPSCRSPTGVLAVGPSPPRLPSLGPFPHTSTIHM